MRKKLNHFSYYHRTLNITWKHVHWKSNVKFLANCSLLGRTEISKGDCWSILCLQMVSNIFYGKNLRGFFFCFFGRKLERVINGGYCWIIWGDTWQIIHQKCVNIGCHEAHGTLQCAVWNCKALLSFFLSDWELKAKGQEKMRRKLPNSSNLYPRKCSSVSQNIFLQKKWKKISESQRFPTIEIFWLENIFHQIKGQWLFLAVSCKNTFHCRKGYCCIRQVKL